MRGSKKDKGWRGLVAKYSVFSIEDSCPVPEMNNIYEPAYSAYV